MSTPILRTKLYIPPCRPQSIPRPQLIKRLDRGLALANKLTLISAPAGCGKSSLLAEWIHRNNRPCAWLSLDEADDSLPRFLTYIIAALQTIIPDKRPRETETYLARIEELIAHDKLDPVERKRLSGAVVGLRAWVAYATGDVDRSIALCHEALAMIEAGQNSWPGLVTLFLASALREQGATAHAAKVAYDGINIRRSAGNFSAGLGAVYLWQKPIDS